MNYFHIAISAKRCTYYEAESRSRLLALTSVICLILKLTSSTRALDTSVDVCIPIRSAQSRIDSEGIRMNRFSVSSADISPRQSRVIFI